MADPVQGLFEVASSRRVGAYHALAVAAPEIAARARPGQFVNVAPAPGSRCLLRRPFSVYAAREGRVEVVFDAVGPGTAWLASRRPGDVLDVVGPLGRAFAPPGSGTACLLVGGGYGAAPMLFLAGELGAAGHRVHLVLGASRAARLLGPEGPDVGRVTVTTEDGSAGARGRVTDALPGLVREDRPGGLYACGPMPMLEAVSRFAEGERLPCQIAVEEFMACGIGVCWTCVFPVRLDGSLAYARACTEGPVFDAARSEWG